MEGTNGKRCHIARRARNPTKYFPWQWGTYIAPGDDIVELLLNMRGKSKEGHTVSGIKNNMYSLDGLVKEGHVPIFERDGFKVYDATNTKIWVMCGAVLQGYYCPNKGLWCIPLLNRGGQAQKTATF